MLNMLRSSSCDVSLDQCLTVVFNNSDADDGCGADSTGEATASTPTSAAEQARVLQRIAAEHYAEQLLSDSDYCRAIEAARSVSSEYAEQVQLACLRAIIDRLLAGHDKHQHPAAACVAPLPTHRPVSEKNLFLALAGQNDSEALYQLRNGARPRWNDGGEHWEQLLLRVCASYTLHDTLAFLVDAEALPNDLDFGYFVAAVNSINTRLAVYMSTLPSVRRALERLDERERAELESRYIYWKCRNFKQLFEDVERMVSLSTAAPVAKLNDAYFLRLVRHMRLFLQAPDEAVLQMRDVLRDDGADAVREALERTVCTQLVDIVQQYPIYDGTFVAAAQRVLSALPPPQQQYFALRAATAC